MSLKRITLATDTLQDFIARPPAQQKILIFLLSHRSMRDRPLRPTHYFSYRDIAEETDLKETTVRFSIASLTKDGWLTILNQRKKFTPTGKPENQFKWTLTKVIEELEQAFQAEVEAEAEVAAQTHLENMEAEDIFLHEEKLWRLGGSLGWQSRKRNSLNGGWADTTLAPDAVIDFFSRT